MGDEVDFRRAELRAKVRLFFSELKITSNLKVFSYFTNSYEFGSCLDSIYVGLPDLE